MTAIFTAAAGATHWRRTSLGLSTDVRHSGWEWTVQLPPESGRAYISGSSGYGGETATYIEATWALTLPVVEGAMSASV